MKNQNMNTSKKTKNVAVFANVIKKTSRKTIIYGENFDEVAVGDYVIFGEYPYTATGEKKPLQWIVMEIKKDKIFLISRYVIDVAQYHLDSKRIPWNRCPIREWLNNQFINDAFPSELKENIIPTRIKFTHYLYNFGSENQNYDFSVDKVFLLGYEEMLKYWPTPTYAKAQKNNNGVPYSKRKATLTPYAKAKEYVDPLAIKYIDHHIYNYLLRDTSNHKIGTVIRKPAAGSTDTWGFYFHQNDIPDGIRPAMWVKK